MPSPRVAIIVLNWNRRDLTLACLGSLRSLDYPNYQTIVVDNGSTDGTPQAVSLSYPDSIVIENRQNLGFAGGNNVGIHRALADAADYVLLLNNDTHVDPRMLNALVSVAESDPLVGITGPVIYYADRPEVIWSAGNAINSKTGEVRRLHADAPGDGLVQPYEVDYVAGTALCIKRGVIERIGPMDSDYFFYFEETEWCLMTRASGYRCVVVPEAHIWHEVSATLGQDSPATTYYMTRNVFRFLKNNFRGGPRWRLLATTWLRESRTVAAHSLKPSYRRLYRHRNARVLGLRDALLGRWGKMGPDVAAVCYPEAG